jgi:hypothetical protein
VVRRSGNLYTAILDTTDDGSSLDYLDSTNWELLTIGQNWRNFWQPNNQYSINDLVIYLGNTYQCNVEHESSDQNYPGDNGSGFFYWDLVLQAGVSSGLSERGDLLSFDLSRSLADDGSTFGPAGVNIGEPGQLLSINESSSVIYKNFGETNRVVYVELDGIDDTTDPQRGFNPFKPWRTIRFACDQLDDNFAGTSTVHVGAGRYDEILPIIVPARTVVLGSELRTTVVNAAGPIDALALDSEYTRAVLSRISQIIGSVLAGSTLNPPKSPNNPEDPVRLTETIVTNVSFNPPRFDPVTGEEIYQSSTSVVIPAVADPQATIDVQQLIADIRAYINFFVNSVGSNPVLVGTNTAETSSGYINAVNILESNKEFLSA